MEVAATLAGWSRDHRRLRSVAAGVVLLLALVACILVARGSTEYDSMALLLYSGTAVTTPGSSPVSATTAAGSRLDNAHLEKLIDHFDLYRRLRKQSADRAVSQMRTKMTLVQPDLYSLQIGFRDSSMENSQDVTNALAEILQSDVVMGVDAASTGAAINSGKSGRTKAKSRSGHSPRAHTPQGKGAAESDGAKTARQKREIIQIGAQLQRLGDKESALQQESTTKQQKIAALIHSQSVAEKPKETPVVDPAAATRNSLKQQIATEKQRLAALRLRYTEAYPDVEDSRDRIAELEKKLAALPPVPRPEIRQTLYQKEMDELTAEESELGARLRRNEEEVSALQRRRDWLNKLVLSPSTQTAFALPPSDLSLKSSAHTPAMNLIPLRPFRILQTATTSNAIKTSHPGAFLWIALGTVVLLGLCLAPAPSREDALITSAGMLRASLPAHVKFIGEVRRIDP